MANGYCPGCTTPGPATAVNVTVERNLGTAVLVIGTVMIAEIVIVLRVVFIPSTDAI